MVLGGFGGMGVGSNARKRGKCQAGQCLIRVGESRMRVGGNWNEIGNSWKAYGKKMEKIGEFARGEWDCKGSAVMRGSARNARLMGQMVYVIWFSF